MNEIMNKLEAMSGSTGGIIGIILIALIFFWIAKKMIKIAILIAIIGALIYYLTNR